MFAFAEDLADAFGRIVVEVIEFIDALDTPQSRETLLQILGIIEWIIDKLAIGAGWLNDWLSFTQSMGDGWLNIFAGVEAAVEGAIEAFDRIKAYVQDVLIPDIMDVFGAMTLGDLVTREITWIGSYRFVDEITDAVEAMRDGLDVSPLITHTFALEEAATAMAVALDPDSGSSKVMLRIG